MNKTRTRARARRVMRALQMPAKEILWLNVLGQNHVTDLIIREEKYYIIMRKSGDLKLYKSWTGVCYGKITLSHAKRLIKTNNKRQ